MKKFYLIIAFLILSGFTYSQNPKWLHYEFGQYISCVASEGDIIWVGTNKGLISINVADLEWTYYFGNDFGSPEGGIEYIAIDKDKNKWIATSTRGLVKFNGVDRTFYNTSNSGIPFNYLHCVSVDREDNIWIGHNGISKFDGLNWTNYDESNSGSVAYPRFIVTDSSNNKWIGTYSNGIIKYDDATWRQFNVGNSAIPVNWVEAMVFDDDNVA